MANKTLSDFPVLTDLDAASVTHVQKELVDYQVALDTLTKYVTDNAEYADLGDKLDGAEEKTTPIDADKFSIWDSVSGLFETVTWANIKATLKTYFDALYPSVNGWTACGVTFTYVSADAPTFTMTAPGDLTGTYKAGMKIKLTQTTDKFFFVSVDPTYSAGTGLTTFTLYGGTDYTLANAAITSPYYSRAKAPYGFPLSPAKWTVAATDTNTSGQNTPTQNQWYNLGSISISLPIGLWRVSYSGWFYSTKTSANADVYATLSTANNSESDTEFTTAAYAYTNVGVTLVKEKILSLVAKTTYYLNEKTAQAATVTNIGVAGSLVTTYIRAVCAYL